LVAEYAAVVSVGVESFDWRTQGDEWVHRVGECLAEIEGFSVTGHRYEYDGTTEPFIDFTGVGPGGATLDTRLVIIPLQEGIYVAIVGKAEEPDEAAAEAWAQAARCATARLGGSGTDFGGRRSSRLHRLELEGRSQPLRAMRRSACSG